MRPEPTRRPAPKPAPTPSPAQRPKRKPLAAPAKRLLLAAALAVSAAVTTWALLGPPVPPAQELDTAQVEARLEAFESAGRIPLEAVDPGDPMGLEDALRSLALESVEQSQRLLTDLREEKVRLAWVELWDDRDADGDVVAVLAGGFSRIIPISHTPVRIALPLPAGLQQIQVRGVKDGGGGITVAIRTPAGGVPLPRLLVGQSISVPVY